MPGRISPVAVAALVGSRCPTPSDEPHPQIGSSATSMSVERCHAREQVGVAWEVDAATLPADDVSDRRCRDAAVRAAAVLVRRGNHLGGHERAIEVDRVADAHLGDVGESGRSQQPAGADRRDEAGVGADAAQRWKVEMIEVCVREQDRVDVGDVRGRQLPASAEVGDAPGQQRVGQDAMAADLDQRGGMADPVHLHAIRLGQAVCVTVSVTRLTKIAAQTWCGVVCVARVAQPRSGQRRCCRRRRPAVPSLRRSASAQSRRQPVWSGPVSVGLVPAAAR